MNAFGAPGLTPTWSSSAKDLVGCALGSARLWFTTGRGIVNEVYWPHIDCPQIRDLGFVVADGQGFWVEVKRHDDYSTMVPQPGIPAIEIVHKHPRFELRLRLVPDPARDALLIEVTLQGDDGLKPYALLAPHLGGSGHDNVAETALHRGRRMLFAERGSVALALAAVDAEQCDAWQRTSAGIVGASDGWQDFDKHGEMTWAFEHAGPGNVALIGELPRHATLALAFAAEREGAATLAVASLCQPIDQVWDRYVDGWRHWHERVSIPAGLPSEIATQLSISAMVLRVHQDKTFSGAMVASLSVPWGNAHDDTGGYHLVWPRDLVESAGALLALGALPEVRAVLRYLIATQLAAGNWPQNQWLGGRPYWHGVQLDETAFPVLLAAALAERDELAGIDVASMIERALSFIARTGPATAQDRWEEDAGINPFTLGACIAALVCGAPWLPEPARGWALRVADDWNARLEDWTVAHDSALARASNVAAHYVRNAPSIEPDGQPHLERVLPIKNRAQDPGLPAAEQVATGFLQLVRLGLRRADDPLMIDTLKVIDRELKVELPTGTTWHRYNDDGYGEQADGSPFDSTGIGRAWPLLAGERGHYELAAGRDPLLFLNAMAAMTGRCGLIPEQVWDAQAIPDKSLAPGRPSGSAMPLVWAHAEFVKLVHSIALGRPFDRPEATWKRYAGKRSTPKFAMWSWNAPITTIRAGHALHLILPHAARVHHGVNGWQKISDIDSADTGLGLHAVTLPTSRLKPGACIDFTLFWCDDSRWEEQDWRIDVQ
ncbi:MAG: glycoside hydrolase family 15 protein [Burkholderiales bacterium]